VDAVIFELARRQHGAVSRAQLVRRGVSDHAIGVRVRDGRLSPVHRGVYLVGPVADPLAMEAAAVLACSPGAVISHRSAAKLQRLLAYPVQASVWVTTTDGDHRDRRSLVLRRSKLDPVDVTRHERIPITTPARTILDLASILEDERLERVCAEAHALGLARQPDLRDQLARNAGRRGAGRLRKLLDGPRAAARTRSVLERKLLRCIRASDLPDPETDQRVGTYVVDFLWRAQRVIVEVDGEAFHSHDRATRRDRRRTNDLQLQGYVVLRFTWDDVNRRPDWVLEEIARALRRAR
jgi:very-short-patch-repair endonuclease